MSVSETAAVDNRWYADLRYGLFVHFGLYSMLGRGEWVLNREQIPLAEYRTLADRFTAEQFNADAICDLAVRAGMRYICLTTMHHEGFRLYDTQLSDFCTTKTAAKRDLVAETMAAARKRGLKIALYHTLNNWMDQPDAVAALENKADYETFIANTFARLKELNEKYKPFDVMWYDGWWPFNAEGWRGEEMNKMVRAIQPNILFNGRNGLPGDFATPEGHLSAPNPWRPWEACMTLNTNWGYNAGDHFWKPASTVLDMLVTVAQGQGNLLLNIGPRGDGSVPEPSVKILEEVGRWLQVYGEAVYDTELCTMDLQKREPHHRADFSTVFSMTVKGNRMYLMVRHWPGRELTLAGLECNVEQATLLGEKPKGLKFRQDGDKLTIRGLPSRSPKPLYPVIRLDCDKPASLYLTGGIRVPRVPHPRYDPCPSDIML
ncbi:MAG: alpha-L-fucosidase [Phycisphaeraceae bacterium]|nr:alpha-L-fucosidase [Phycisphaeraceae bacterium]